MAGLVSRCFLRRLGYRSALLHDGLRAADLPRVAAVPSPDRCPTHLIPMWMQGDVLQNDVLQSNSSRAL